MFAGELMENSRKNPKMYEGKRYEPVCGNVLDCNGKRINAVTIHDGELLVDGDSGNYAFASSYCKLKEIKQSVPLQKAIKAWLDGKTVYVELNGTRYSTFLSDDELIKLNRCLIKTGIWYIDD